MKRRLWWRQYGKVVGSSRAIGGGRGQGEIDPRPWQQEGDWPCPNSRFV